MSPTLKPLRAVLNKVGDGARGIFKRDFQGRFSRLNQLRRVLACNLSVKTLG